MPRGLIETHPYLAVGEKCPCPIGLILGTFPVYECSLHANSWNVIRSARTRQFFYGSADNRLWRYYKEWVDPEMSDPVAPGCTLLSLYSRGIAITDLLKSSYRYNKKRSGEIVNEYSSDDSALQGGEWNRRGIELLLNKGVNKILCTSKGVMDWLTHSILCTKRNPVAELLADDSISSFQEFVVAIGGVVENEGGPIIAKMAVYKLISDSSIVTALALPSPGSPQRQLAEFGLPINADWRRYTDRYFQRSFEWLVGV